MKSFYKQSFTQLLILFGGISNAFLAIWTADQKYAWEIVGFTCAYHFIAYMVLMNWNHWWARHIDAKAKQYLKKDIWDGVDYE